MESELKRCPFCGKQATIVKSVAYNWRYYIACRNRSCGVNPYTETCLTKDKAVETWNRRAEQ